VRYRPLINDVASQSKTKIPFPILLWHLFSRMKNMNLNIDFYKTETN
jgi:hypothetical protein